MKFSKLIKLPRPFIKALILLGILMYSCGQTNSENTESQDYTDFYKVIDDFLCYKYYDALVVQLETEPLFKIHPYFIDNKQESDELVPPPPPPTENIILNKSFFNELVDNKIIDSIDADYMYNSIDSTIILSIDNKYLNTTLIREKELDSIFNNPDVYGYDILYEKYNATSFVEISTPLFNKSNDKMIFTINYYCGDLCGRGLIYVLSKQNNKWKIIDTIGTWIS
jgi:hypothetical protein